MAIGDALRSLERDTEITSDEITPQKLVDLKAEIEACTPDQSEECIAILDAAIGKAQGDAITGLQGLRDNIETQSASEYSLESLQTKIEDEKAKAFLKLYNTVIAKDLEKLYGAEYTNLKPESSKETIKLVFWDIIQSQLGVRGAMNIGVGKITSLTEGFRGLFGDAEEDATESILTAHLKSQGDIFSQLQPDAKEDIEGMIEIVESLLGKQANNLKKLFDISSGFSDEHKKTVFGNPNILSEILNKGKYKENGFDIDLDEGKIVIGETLDLETVQGEFMTELIKNTDNIGSSVERIRATADKFENLLKTFGMEGGVDELKETLFKIPLIGIFFKMIFGDFFDKFDKAEALERIDSLIGKLTNPNQKAALNNLKDTFIPEFLEDESTLETPLGKVLGTLDENFYGSISPFLETLETAEVNITDAHFWKHILTGGAGEGSIENKIYEYLKGTLESSDVTAEKLADKMNSIPADILVSQVVENTPEIPDLNEQINAVSSFPFTLKTETGEKEVSYNDNTLKIGDRSFSLNFKHSERDINFLEVTNIGIVDNNIFTEISVDQTEEKMITGIIINQLEDKSKNGEITTGKITTTDRTSFVKMFSDLLTQGSHTGTPNELGIFLEITEITE